MQFLFQGRPNGEIVRPRDDITLFCYIYNISYIFFVLNSNPMSESLK